jgi:hypothetical protein
MSATTAAPSPIGAAHALHRSRAHVADGERARHAASRTARQARSAAGRPASGARRLRAREHEAVRIDGDAAALEPRGLRIGADEHEDVAQVAPLLAAVARTAPAHAAQARGGAAVDRDQLGA